MTRFIDPFLGLILTSSVASAHEENLRSNGTAVLGQLQRANGISIDDDVGGTFKVEKGFKCQCGRQKDKGGSKKCQGGMKSEFTMGFTMDDIAMELANQIMDKTNNFIPGIEAYHPDEEAIEVLIALDSEEALERMEEGRFKTIELGGFMHVGFGCKVTFSREKRKFVKKSRCGFKGMSGTGKKPDDDDLYPFEEREASEL